MSDNYKFVYNKDGVTLDVTCQNNDDWNFRFDYLYKMMKYNISNLIRMGGKSGEIVKRLGDSGNRETAGIQSELCKSVEESYKSLSEYTINLINTVDDVFGQGTSDALTSNVAFASNMNISNKENLLITLHICEQITDFIDYAAKQIGYST